MSLLPSSPDPPTEEGEPRVVGVDSEDADRLLSALSSETARKLLAGLHDEPATPSGIADRLDTSVQNAQYHLGKLEDAELVRVVDTCYSEKGREMDVYGPADRPLVMFAGRERKTAGLKTALSRLLGGVGVLGLASLVIERQLSRGGLLGLGSFRSGGGVGGDSDSLSGANESATTVEETSGQAGVMDDGATGAPEPTGTEAADGSAGTVAEEATETAGDVGVEFVTEATRTAAEEATRTTEAATTVAESGADAAAVFSPGLLFFAGGLAVLLGGFAYWYLRVR